MLERLEIDKCFLGIDEFTLSFFGQLLVLVILRYDQFRY